MIHTVYIDRTLGSINGVLTLQFADKTGRAIKLFDRLPCTSGQYPYTDGGADDWVTAKGATPMGVHWLSTRRERLWMTPGGPFYVLSSKKGERTIQGPHGKQRTNAGIHYENEFPGTAGCTALIKSLRSEAFFKYLDALYAQGVYYIKCVVL